LYFIEDRSLVFAPYFKWSWHTEIIVSSFWSSLIWSHKVVPLVVVLLISLSLKKRMFLSSDQYLFNIAILCCLSFLLLKWIWK
jgi:hypothetical protein